MEAILDKSFNTLANWIEYESPYVPVAQNKPWKFAEPTFDDRRTTYPSVDNECYGPVNSGYNFFERKCYENLIADKKRRENANFLSKGHLCPRSYVTYAYLRTATHYYSNVAPQWQLTNGGNYGALEDCITNIVANDPRKNIYTGTHGVLKFQQKSKNNLYIPAKLNKTCTLRIPEVFWKSYKNENTNKHVVFIVFNSPCPESPSGLIDRLQRAGCNRDICEKIVSGYDGTCRKLPLKQTRWRKTGTYTHTITLEEEKSIGMLVCCNSIKDARSAFQGDGSINEFNLPGLDHLDKN